MKTVQRTTRNYKILSFSFQFKIVQGIIPSQWKTAIIVPVYKKGSRDNPGNYRPISFTCVLSCVFEYILADKMLEHLYSHNLLSESQFGFLRQHSACSQLLCVLNKWFRAFESNESIDIIYTDIAKAFDSVCHNKLITVLSTYGFRGKILFWIKSFLSNRFQYVSINNQCSTPSPVISSVPQDSILGPLLFVIYINDIVDITPLSHSHNGLYLYADDAKLFDIGSNFINLQAVLDKLSTWLQERQLDLAASKCDHLCVTRACLMF